MPPIRIVLVDDAEEMRLLISLSLTLTGDFVVVGEGGTGRDAVALAEEHRPDLMLLDLSMPEMDGLEALPLVLAASPGTRVVVFSGFDEAQLGRDARALGATGYVEKGTPLEELGPLLKRYLEGPLQSGA